MTEKEKPLQYLMTKSSATISLEGLLNMSKMSTKFSTGVTAVFLCKAKKKHQSSKSRTMTDYDESPYYQGSHDKCT